MTSSAARRGASSSAATPATSLPPSTTRSSVRRWIPTVRAGSAGISRCSGSRRRRRWRTGGARIFTTISSGRERIDGRDRDQSRTRRPSWVRRSWVRSAHRVGTMADSLPSLPSSGKVTVFVLSLIWTWNVRFSPFRIFQTWESNTCSFPEEMGANKSLYVPNLHKQL